MAQVSGPVAPQMTQFLDPGPQNGVKVTPVQEVVSDKQSLCVDILVNGYVNSFVDFFYLTHRADDDAKKASLTEDRMFFIKENLTIAEKAHRRGDSERVLEAYEQLAQFFQDSADYKTGIYFYEKTLDISESMDDLPKQGNANLNLGLTHDAMGDTSTAIKFHERHLQLAIETEDKKRLQQANQQLVESYRRYAEEHEKKKDNETAVKLYKKCLTAAVDARDLKSEGMATYRLGIACGAVNDKTASIEYHQRYLEICKKIGDQLGEGAACAALAHSFKDVNDVKLAIRYLEKYLDIASRNKQAVAQAEACAALGSIFSEVGEHERAVQYFEKTFEIAKSVGDRKLTDSARINLGMARGNMHMVNYMDVVNENLPALLKWKTRRVNF